MYHPMGITAHHDKVYVADQFNHRISVYLTSGEYCFSFGSRGSNPQGLDNFSSLGVLQLLNNT